MYNFPEEAETRLGDFIAHREDMNIHDAMDFAYEILNLLDDIEEENR